MTGEDGLPRDRQTPVRHFIDLAMATPGMVEGLRTGRADAIAQFFEMAPGAHVEALVVKSQSES